MGNLYTSFPYISTDRIILRKILKTDIEELFEIYSNKNVFTFIPGEVRKNKDTVLNMVGHFERDFNKRKNLVLGICLSEVPKGYWRKTISLRKVY